MSNCNIIVLRCDDKNDLKLLERLKQIEDKQKSYFLDFLTLKKYGCRKDKYIYFISLKPSSDIEEEQLCGVCQTHINKENNTISINYLTSRAATDINYKGVGTKLLNSVIDYCKIHYQNLIGIELISADEALYFYDKYGFISSNNNKFFKFYPFEIYIKRLDKKNVLNMANQLEDKNTIDKLIKDGINLKETVELDPATSLTGNKYTVISVFLLKNYYNDLKVNDENVYNYYIMNKKLNIIEFYLRKDNKYLRFINEKTIIDIINSNIYIPPSFIEQLYISNFKFTEKILSTLLEKDFINKNIIEIIINSGVKITDKKDLTKIKEKYINLEDKYNFIKNQYESYKLVYDLSKLN